MDLLPVDGLHGRRKIFFNGKSITQDNVVQMLSSTYAIHNQNRYEIQYLYDYYRGKQDIRCKVKTIRPEINNKVTVNRANEIVTFKVSYLLGDPLQYVSRGSNESVSTAVNELNEYMYAEGKASKDKEVAEWAHICGVGCRMVLPSNDDMEESPVKVYTLDPRNAFVVYSTGLGNPPLAGVIESMDEDGTTLLCVYTKDAYYEIKNNKIKNFEMRRIPFVPVIEYVHNEARMGAFEVVLPLLNALNTLESNRVDDVEQFVQAILVFENCEINEEIAQSLKEQLGLMIKSSTENPARVYRVDGELSQSGAQTLVDDLYDTVLTITGMPNRNGGSSTSDTGAATIMRDGWQSAEARAKDSETLFERSEREFLKIALYILRETGKLTLKLSDVGLKFTRHNYADIQSKAQVLCEMLNNEKIHPKLAFIHCGMFTDAEEAYRISEEYYQNYLEEENRTLRDELNENTETIPTVGQGNLTSTQESNQEV